MNLRIKRKKEKQMLTWAFNELVAEAQREEERRQAAIRRTADAYLKYLDEVTERERQYYIRKGLLRQ